MDLEEIVTIAEAAGNLLAGYYGRIDTADARRKGGRRRDLVSEADVAAEDLILRHLPPGDEVLAEESGARAGSARCWIVDPLDGTINFLRGIPFWCVSIALREGDELRAGVVHAPILGMTFTAEAGRGARLGARRLRVSEVEELQDAVLGTGFPYARDTLADNNLANISGLGAEVGGLRRMGSAALDLAFTAAGRLDGFWELHLNAWDVAAGILLVREAGGTVSDFHGSQAIDSVLFGRHIVATNGPLHDKVRDRLAPLRDLA